MPRRITKTQAFEALLERFERFEADFKTMKRRAFEPRRRAEVAADVPDVLFAYEASQWAVIEGEMRSLPRFEQLDLAPVRRNLEDAARLYFLRRAVRPPSRWERMQRWEKVWRNIEKLEESIISAVEADFGLDLFAGGHFDEYGEAISYGPGSLDEFGLAPLHQLKHVVASYAVDLGGEDQAQIGFYQQDLSTWSYFGTRPTDGKSGDQAQIGLYEQVLRTWWTLGGELTRPTDGASGPFPRFFFAVVGPVMGEDQPSRLSLRDIVKTYEERPEDRTYRERQEDCRGK
jgi:hypothetical protein